MASVNSFFVKGELVVCLQRNDCFDHVPFFFSFRLSRVFGAFVFNMRGVRVYIGHKHVYRLEKRPLGSKKLR